MNASYSAYLQSSEWAERRRQKLEQIGYRCQGCDETERLEVHHLSYAKVGNERLEELMVLCRLCHAAEHRREPNIGPVAGRKTAEIAGMAYEQRRLKHRQERCEGFRRLRIKAEWLQRQVVGEQRKRAKTIVHNLRALEREAA